jgi:hypothetical protein
MKTKLRLIGLVGCLALGLLSAPSSAAKCFQFCSGAPTISNCANPDPPCTACATQYGQTVLCVTATCAAMCLLYDVDGSFLSGSLSSCNNDPRCEP